MLLADYDNIEKSIEQGSPIELYIFTYDGIQYQYTSAKYDIITAVNGITGNFTAEYIKRGDSLKLGNMESNSETCTITMNRASSIGQLFIGAPPENGAITVEVYRAHTNDITQLIKIIDGVVSQITFQDSEIEITVTIENVLSRNIPNGTFSYYCQNCIYDYKCGLSMKKYEHECRVREMNILTIKSDSLLNVPNGYMTDGFMKMGRCMRRIRRHEGDTITIKYPVMEVDKRQLFYTYPSCSNVFEYCTLRFNNQRNFSGIPYLPPYDVYKHKARNDIAYWVDDSILKRDSHGEIGKMGL